MGFQNHPYIYILLFSAICCALAAWIVWQRRKKPGALAFFTSMIGYILWSGVYALQWATTSLDAQVFFLSLTFFGVGLTTAATVWFGLDWTGRMSWLTPPRTALLIFFCAAPGLLALTDPWHHLYYASLSQRMVNGFVVLDWGRGPGFLLFGLLFPMMITAGVLGLLFFTWRHSRGLLRRQAATFLFAALLPYAAVIGAQTILRPEPFLDAPPVVACVYALIMIHGLYFLRLFDVIPLARDTLIESMDVGVVVFDSQNRIVDANLSAKNLLGLSTIQVGGISLEEAFHGFPQIMALYNQVVSETWAGKGALQEEIAFEDGFETSLSLRISPLLDLVGNPLGRLMTIQDITAQKVTEDALRQSEQRYRLLAQNFTDVVWTTDLDGRFTYVSPSVFRLRGFTPEEVLEQRMEEAISPGSLPKIMEGFEAALNEIRTGVKAPEKYIEIEQPCKDGSSVWTEALARVMYDDNGRPLGLLGVTRDITERNKTQEALSLAKEAAETASRAKTAFLANMSHELRTPLNAILGFSDILEHSPHLQAEERENIAIINRSGEHLLNLINDILDITKIEAGQMVTRETGFDLFDLLHGLEDMFRLRAEEKNIMMRISVAPATPQDLLGDQGKLRQILINLLGNALKFTHQGSVMLWVRAAVEGTSAHFQFDVTDTGQGIPPDERTRIFLPFQQVVDKQRGVGGSGLGLTISREFAHLMGGDLVVSSELDLGSCFTLTVPFRLAGNDQEKRRYSSGRHARGIQPGQKECRVLIAEDVMENRVLLLRILEPLGLSIRTAENGREAVEIWHDWRPHLIFMDIRMPVMNGLEAVKWIKNEAAGQDPVIVAITASVFEENRAAVEAAGFDDLIRKPYREEEIYSVLEKRLGLELIYDEDQEWWLGAEEPAQPPLTPTAGISMPLLHALRTAALQADLDEIRNLLDQATQQDPAFAEMIKKSVDAFDYRKIVDGIDQIGGKND